MEETYKSRETKQTKSVIFLSLTELWERFGFYIVQGMLVVYATQFLGFDDKKSFTIGGMYAGLVYISGIIGGFIADRLLGFKTTILWGGTFLILGYALLASSSHPYFFYLSLGTIIIGNGLLKPNISSLLGTQYEADDPKRDSAFTIFYMGINIGAALSGIAGYIRADFGWHVMFACASLGMLIGMSTFLYGLKYIKTTQSIKPHNKFFILLFLIVCIAITSLLIDLSNISDWLLPIAGIMILIYLSTLTMQQQADRRHRLFLLLLLIGFSILFWMLFFQLFFSANLFAERLAIKDFFGIKLSSSVFYASEGFFVILLAPVFAWIWSTFSNQNQRRSYFSKFAMGFVFLGLCFIVLSISTHFPNALGLVPPLWLFFAYFLLTIGEMMLSPIGLAAVTQLAPQELTGFMMGVWFVALGFGGMFGGMIANLAALPENITSNADKLAVYHHAFVIYAVIALITAFVIFLLRFMIANKPEDMNLA